MRISLAAETENEICIDESEKYCSHLHDSQFFGDIVDKCLGRWGGFRPSVIKSDNSYALIAVSHKVHIQYTKN